MPDPNKALHLSGHAIGASSGFNVSSLVGRQVSWSARPAVVQSGVEGVKQVIK